MRYQHNMSLSQTDLWWECSCLVRQTPTRCPWEPHCITATKTSRSVVKVTGETLPCTAKPCSFPIFYCSALTMAVLNCSLQNCTPGIGWFPLNIIYSPLLLIFDLFHVIKWLSPGSAFLSHEQCFVMGKLLCSLPEMWHLTQRKAPEEANKTVSWKKTWFLQKNPTFFSD